MTGTGPPPAAASTSCQWRGADTVGRGRARSEYTDTVVLCSSFWLQSMRTLPRRSSLAMFDTTSLGWARSPTWARARAKPLVWS